MGWPVDRKIKVYVYDDNLKILPDGELGELYYETPYAWRDC